VIFVVKAKGNTNFVVIGGGWKYLPLAQMDPGLDPASSFDFGLCARFSLVLCLPILQKTHLK
jgi:hypothetical protein